MRCNAAPPEPARPPGRRWAWRSKLILAAGAGALAWVLCRQFPATGPAALNAAARAATYGGMLFVFARSLRPGQQPLVTRIARRVDPRMAPRRLAYTRAVTWVWTIFFAVNLLATVATITPGRALPWFAASAGIPLAIVLFALELSVRAVWFRGQVHGSAADMVRDAVRHAPARSRRLP